MTFLLFRRPAFGVHVGAYWHAHGPGLSLLVRSGDRPFGVRVGWGFDKDLPLRPWPAVARVMAGPGKQHRDLCAGWLGFYVGFRWAP